MELMAASPTPQTISILAGDLPERVFAVNRYTGHLVRINSYSKPRYLIDILHILAGLPGLQTLLASPLAALFSLHVRHSSLSGQLVHQMLCRQLLTPNTEEMWFIYGGQPLRFSLIEFEELTGLSCAPCPPPEDLLAATTHSDGSAPYWYTLISRTLGQTTVENLLILLKNEPNMPVWRRFRIALVVIVEGVLLCRTQPVKPSLEVVEMVKYVVFFLQYPWGRHAFNRLLRMVTVGDYIPDKASLLKKIKQSSLAVHGFPLPIQLLAFRCIPLLLKILPHSQDQSMFLDQTVTSLPKCKSDHAYNILAVEHDPSLEVLFPFQQNHAFVSTTHADKKVKLLQSLVATGYKFNKTISFGDDSSLPSLLTPSNLNVTRNKYLTSKHRPTKQRKTSAVFTSVEDVHGLITLRLEDFKDSFLADLGCLLLNANSRNTVTHALGESSSNVASAEIPQPSAQTHYASVDSSNVAYDLIGRSTRV